MANWIEWFRTHVHWFVFLILEAISLTMLFRFNLFHHSVWATQSNAVAGKVLEWESGMHSYFNLREINEQLTMENLALQHKNEALRDELLDLKRDTGFVESLMHDHLKNYKIIPGHVISNSIRQKDNLITLDKGAKDGVKTEMGVVCGTGVVGIIYEVSEHYSIVLPILNSHSSISCRLRGTEYFGSLKWKGGSPLDAFVDDIPRHAHFRVGDIVETSGFSSVFPEGIFLGKVSEIYNSPDGASYELKIRLSSDLAVLRDVNIVSHVDKEEIDSLKARVVKKK